MQFCPLGSLAQLRAHVMSILQASNLKKSVWILKIKDLEWKKSVILSFLFYNLFFYRGICDRPVLSEKMFFSMSNYSFKYAHCKYFVQNKSLIGYFHIFHCLYKCFFFSIWDPYLCLEQGHVQTVLTGVIGVAGVVRSAHTRTYVVHRFNPKGFTRCRFEMK